MKVLAKYTKTQDPKLLRETYSVFVANALLERPYTTEQGIQMNLDGLKERIKNVTNAKPQEFYDNRLVEKLDKVGIHPVAISAHEVTLISILMLLIHIDSEN